MLKDILDNIKVYHVLIVIGVIIITIFVVGYVSWVEHEKKIKMENMDPNDKPMPKKMADDYSSTVFKGRDFYFDYATQYGKNYKETPYYKSLITIEETNSCIDLKKLYDDNTGWYARPMLKDKIDRVCP